MNLKSLAMQMGTGLPADAPAPTAKAAPAAFPAALKAAHAAHKSGDHAGAKRHVFTALKALPSAPKAGASSQNTAPAFAAR